MKKMIKKYALNCFLLTLPVLIWNILLTDKLPREFEPAIFWSDIPTFIVYGENIARFLIVGLAFIMPLKIETKIQKNGLVVYVVGLLFYFASWLFLINFPQWTNNIVVFMSPAYTPLFWLAGIALIGNSFYFNVSFKKWYFILISGMFLIFHNLHTFLVFSRT